MIRRAAALVATTFAVLALAGVAAAHPLGNFTTNRYDELVLSGDRIYIVSVLDLAEIPTFQARTTLLERGRAGYASDLARSVTRGLDLEIDGSPRALRVVKRRLTFPAGAAGLRTSRLEAVLDGGPLTGGEHTVSLRNTLFSGRIGWREIVISAERGARLLESTVPARGVSDRLRSYPRDLLSSPLDVTSATARATPGDQAGVAPSLGPPPTQTATVTGDGGFVSLIERQKLTLGVVAVALAIAFFWGAAHALTPGHGKALVAGYLVGTRGRPRHAFVLGATVTITHTAGVFALGFVTLALSQFIVPERLYPWLTLVSGLLVVTVGVGVLRSRLRSRDLKVSDSSRTGGAHVHAHDHHHADDALTSRGLLGVGIAAGLLPCPSALVVLLSAIALHRLAFGLALIVAFSVGLAATVTGIGLVAVLARRAFSPARLDGRLIGALPAISAAVILVVGLVLTAKAIPGVV
jgi:ABC-type nickel/cobalt efflux system permease component RcnA